MRFLCFYTIPLSCSTLSIILYNAGTSNDTPYHNKQPYVLIEIINDVKKNKLIVNSYEEYNLNNDFEQPNKKPEDQNINKSLNNDKPKYIDSILQSNKERQNMHRKAKETIDKIKVDSGLVEKKEVFITNNYSKIKNLEIKTDLSQNSKKPHDDEEISKKDMNKVLEIKSNIADIDNSMINIVTKVEESKKDSLETIKQRYLERKRQREQEVTQETKKQK